MQKTTTEKQTLEVKSRELVGKKAKKLRKQGLVLANIYGPEFKSKSVSVDLKSLLKTYKIVKETGVVYLKLDSSEVPVLIKNIQKHPVTDFILHVDFRKIDLKKKLKPPFLLKRPAFPKLFRKKVECFFSKRSQLILKHYLKKFLIISR